MLAYGGSAAVMLMTIQMLPRHSIRYTFYCTVICNRADRPDRSQGMVLYAVNVLIRLAGPSGVLQPRRMLKAIMEYSAWGVPSAHVTADRESTTIIYHPNIQNLVN